MTDADALEIVKLLRESKDAIVACLDRDISDETMLFASENVENAATALQLAEEYIDENLP